MKYFLLGAIAILVVIQFFRIDQTNPEYDQQMDFINMEKPGKSVENILVSACYDCHSYETTYPWYADVAPISWWLADHIEEGREHLNFSDWGKYSVKRKKHKLDEMVEEVEEGEMPLSSYTLAHGDADLTAEQQAELMDWLKNVNSGL